MAKRVILGKIGTGVNEYGLRVSKSGNDAINTDGTAVSIDNLAFDSLNPIGHFPVWRIYDETAPAGTENTTTKVITPGEITRGFGVTLSGPPMAYPMWKQSSTRYIYGYLIRAFEDANYETYGGSRQYTDDGLQIRITSGDFTLRNYNTTSRDYRVILFKVTT